MALRSGDRVAGGAGTGWRVVLLLLSVAALLPPAKQAFFDQAFVDTATVFCKFMHLSGGALETNEPLDIVDYSHTFDTSLQALASNDSLINPDNWGVSLVLLVPGYQTDLNSESTVTLVEAFRKKYQENPKPKLVVIDPRFDSFYPLAVGQVNALANGVYKIIAKLLSIGYSLNNIHLIGYSLGATVVSIAARIVKTNLGKVVGIITLLDPPNICVTSDNFIVKLEYGKFVQVFHTSPGVIGNHVPLGHLDVYFATSPHCLPLANRERMLCDHEHSWRMFAKSVYEPRRSFVGRRCKNVGKLYSKEERFDAVRARCTGEPGVVGYWGRRGTARQVYFYNRTAHVSMDPPPQRIPGHESVYNIQD